MKTITKLVAGTAMLASAMGAHAAITAPSTGSSQLLFFVTDPVSSLTYTEVLTQTVGTGSSVFNSGIATANASSAVEGVSAATVTTSTSFSYAASANSDLQSFISAHSADGLQYGIMGGAYSSNSPVGRRVTGASLAVTSSPDTTPYTNNGESKIAGTQIAATGLDADISTLNQGTFDSHNGTNQGVIGTAASVGQLIDWYGTGVNVVSAIGTSMELFGVSGNGKPSGFALAYDLGKLSFDGNTLTFTANSGTAPPVPLPAAAWLFGSGLLGLLGIGRRRNAVAAA
jgi:hypothetical protein